MAELATATTFLQTQSLPAWTTKLHATATLGKQLDPSLGTDSVISSEEETDCESDRGSCTPLRDDQARLEAYMARKGMKRSAFQQRFGAERLSPCCFARRPEASKQQLPTTDPMAIPSKSSNAYQGWDDDGAEDCRCGNDCGSFFQESDAVADADGLDDMIFDLEI